ncbi:MAG TPA: M20/M25/M40 family metallo-hydrolase [Thermoanaerobaculia bacterium]|jgi:glutamate carboxypeptidase|nr:M20/M25/M40 family metallo-hydrolase [Thermoanaerobaculia bacterium]
MPPLSPADAILDHLRRQEGEMAGLLADLARLESPSVVPASQGPVLDRLAGELRGLGMRVRRLRGKASGGHLFAASSRPPAGPAGRAGHGAAAGPRLPAQLLLGHCDTVWPLGMLATMPVETRDGRLYGPGVYDMKGGLVQALFALRALRELRLDPPAMPLLFVNSDEEIGSGESTRWVRLLARGVRRVFVLEPSLGPEGRLKTGRKGVGQFVVTVRGRAAHAGLEPERGASAVLELSHVIQRLHALADPARGIAVNVGVVSGGLRGNVVPPDARAEVDVRVLWEDDVPALEAAIRGLAPTLPGTRLEVTGAIDRPPLIATPANLALWRTAAAAARRLGLPLGHGTAGGASDGNTTSRTTATLDGLGAVGGGAHSVDEHVELARMPERAALLALLLLAPLEEAAAEEEAAEETEAAAPEPEDGARRPGAGARSVGAGTRGSGA